MHVPLIMNGGAQIGLFPEPIKVVVAELGVVLIIVVEECVAGRLLIDSRSLVCCSIFTTFITRERNYNIHHACIP